MRFNPQVLHLVFLFGTTYAAPARKTTIPTATASLDDHSLSLTLKISPQLISSVADFAPQVVSAIFFEEKSRGTRNPLDDESATAHPTPQPASLSTRIAAAPSDSKNPAVTSSSSTLGRSRTGLSSSPAIARRSSSRVLAQTTTRARMRPHHSSLTTEDQVTALHHATQPGPTNTHAVSTQKTGTLPISNTVLSQGSDVVNMSKTTADLLDAVSSIAIGQAASLTGSAQDENPSATNALDILFSALPSSYAAPLQSEFSDILDPIASGIDNFTSDLFDGGERISQTHTPPTTRLTTTHRPPHSAPFTTPPTTDPTTTPTPLPPPPTTTTTTQTTDDTIFSTMLTRPSDTNPAPSASTGHSAANPISNASTIGIATGIASGVVLLCLGGLYLYRRRSAGLAPFGKRGGSKRSNRVYPEVAWLYDPDITPPRSRAGSGSGTQLIPEPRQGSVEIGGTAVGGASPEMRGQGSPLLAPQSAAGGRGRRGDMVGSRSRSGSEVDVERLQPLSMVREETPRGSFSRG